MSYRTALRLAATFGLVMLAFALALASAGQTLSAVPNSGRADGEARAGPSAAGPGDGGVSPSSALSETATFTTLMPLLARNDGPRGPFALQFYGAIAPSTGFTYAVASRAGWIRYQVRWSSVEPFNTTPPFFDYNALDASVEAATSAGMNLILTIEFNPAWAAATPNGPVTNTAELAEFAGALAARYPQVRYWEMYNEPDSLFAFGNNGAAYANVLKAVYPAVKAANSQAQVVFGGLAMDWCEDVSGPFDCEFLEDVLNHCTQPCFDLANFHYYPVYRKTWEPYGRDILGKANRLRQRLAARGYARPLINTETGWPFGDQWGSEALQSRYVPKTFVRGLAAGLPATSWYSMLDADQSQPGLLGGTSPPFVPRKAYRAFVRLSSLLSAGTYVRTLTPAETGSAFVEGYQFSVPGPVSLKRIDVVWYDCPGLIVNTTSTPNLPVDCGNRAGYRVPGARVGVLDHVDGPQVILKDGDDGQADGWVTIPGGVGTDPIYIDFNP